MNLPEKIRLPVLVTVLVAVLSGCTQHSATTQRPRVPATPFSVAATGDPAFDPSQARTFAWSSNMQDVASVQRLQDVPLEDMLRDSIAGNMNSKGYRNLAYTGKADLVIGYSVSLDDAATSSAAAREHGVQPGLAFTTPDPEKFEKGTIVIEVREAVTGLIAWRSALQGFSIIELDDADRRKRLDGMVQRMLSGLPARVD